MSQHHAYAQDMLGRHAIPSETQSARPGAAVGGRAALEMEMLPWGIAFEAGDGAAAEPVCQIIADFGEVESEYAAIRTAAGIMDCPNRGTIIVSGRERRDLLNRLITQELRTLEAGQTREAFWLNRKGRIEADLFLIEEPERTLIDLDVANAAAAVKSLGDFVFTEDAQIRDASEEFHHLAVHGRFAHEVIRAAAGDMRLDLRRGASASLRIAGVAVVAARRDHTGEPGFEIIVQRQDATRVWEGLRSLEVVIGGAARKARPIGWHAYNIARIEAGEPLFNIDFGPSNLPHQTGVLQRRVSFTKGCYLGQEIVARMHSRGHSKPALLGLRMQRDVLPVAGAQVFAGPGAGASTALGEQVGVITSSTLSPMLSAAPIAFAMLKPVNDGDVVLVNAEGEQVSAVVGPLRHWPASGLASPAAQAAGAPAP
jgi:folate-binding protein YgfZ